MSDKEFELDDLVDAVDVDEGLGHVPTEEEVLSQSAADDDSDEDLDQEEAAEAASDEPLEDEEDEPEFDSTSDNELAEVNWYGKKGKISKDLLGYLNKFFTETNQKAAEEKRAALEEAGRVKQEAVQAREEALALQAALKAHLDANPEFAESWDESQSTRDSHYSSMKASSEIAELRKELEAIKGDRERQRAAQELGQTLGNLAQQFKLDPNSPLDNDDIQQLAVSRVIASNSTVSLEDAYAAEVSKANQRARSSKIQYIKKKEQVRRKAPTEGANISSNKEPKKVDFSKMSLDDMLDYHMKVL